MMSVTELDSLPSVVGAREVLVAALGRLDPTLRGAPTKPCDHPASHPPDHRPDRRDATAEQLDARLASVR